ncbi:N-acetylneuraminate synthase [Bdellovibrio sp. HCB337]|uniref:N-acetylneuraminate synthase n=1 Tax=Bdellovibrio sp. HCB337 TaxID=3394358 RepID=UPI0039A6B2A6
MKNACLVIAEAGVNHNGDLKLAKQLVDIAVEAGADIVKFQTFKASSLVTQEAKMAAYQKANTGKTESQYEMLKRLELSHEDHHTLMQYCREKNIEFLSTGFDEESLLFLNELGLRKFKIPSGEMTNYPYLKLMASFKPELLVMSTGMATMAEVKNSFDLLVKSGVDKERIVVLHCTTDYPTALKDVNLSSMVAMGKELGCRVGYSDHTTSLEVPLSAVALGATVIEKHFTVSKDLPGPDHKASLEGAELKEMVKRIRDFSTYWGLPEKKPTSQELQNRLVARKSIVAKTDIAAGEVLSEKNLTTKRPGTGVDPMQWPSVLGTKAKRSFKQDELIEL